jgi:hypothetical protein
MVEREIAGLGWHQPGHRIAVIYVEGAADHFVGQRLSPPFSPTMPDCRSSPRPTFSAAGPGVVIQHCGSRGQRRTSAVK